MNIFVQIIILLFIKFVQSLYQKIKRIILFIFNIQANNHIDDIVIDIDIDNNNNNHQVSDSQDDYRINIPLNINDYYINTHNTHNSHKHSDIFMKKNEKIYNSFNRYINQI